MNECSMGVLWLVSNAVSVRSYRFLLKFNGCQKGRINAQDDTNHRRSLVKGISQNCSGTRNICSSELPSTEKWVTAGRLKLPSGQGDMIFLDGINVKSEET